MPVGAILGLVKQKFSTPYCKINSNFCRALMTSGKKAREIELVRLVNITCLTSENKLLENSAQRDFTLGGELYVVFPPGKIFLLCPYSVCTANKRICKRTQF